MLCNADNSKEFRMDFMAAMDSGDHQCIGTKMMTIDEMSTITDFKVDYTNISIIRFELKPVVNFLEYIFGGCQLNLVVAVDFTASNGQVTEHNSLHNRDPNRNQYLQALKSVGGILQYYDSDKLIPAYGFGARI